MSTGYQMDQTFAVWRILVGAVIIVAIYGLGLFGIGFFLNGMAGLDLTQSSQKTLIVFLASFIPIWLGTGAVTRVLFGFSLPHLYGRSGNIRWSDFHVAFVYIFVIVLLLELLVFAATWVMGTTPYTRNDAVSIFDWLIYLMPLIVLVFLQIGAEELFFRGYLLRLIYSRKARLFWAVYVPSFLFGLAHLDPITYGFNSVLYVLNTAVTGVHPVFHYSVAWEHCDGDRYSFCCQHLCNFDHRSGGHTHWIRRGTLAIYHRAKVCNIGTVDDCDHGC